MIDIGINIFNKQFNQDKEEVLDRAIAAGVSQMILTGVNLENSQKAKDLSLLYPKILYSTAGIHPHEAKTMNENSKSYLNELLKNSQVVSVGECGLDFDRNFSSPIVQEKCFRMQLELSIEVQKPLFLHERAAFERFSKILNEYEMDLPKAVIHCFTGTRSEAEYYLEKGFYLGFTGAITSKHRFPQLNEIIAMTPLDRMMVETDAPFMLPKYLPKSENLDRRNEPSYLPYVIKHIAEVRRMSISEVARQTTITAMNFFNLDN